MSIWGKIFYRLHFSLHWPLLYVSVSTRLYYCYYYCLFSSVCGYAATPLTFDEVLNTSVIYSISKAWCLGRAVQRAKGDPDPVKAILESVKGKEIMNGKVITI